MSNVFYEGFLLMLVSQPAGTSTAVGVEKDPETLEQQDTPGVTTAEPLDQKHALERFVACGCVNI